MTKKKQNKMLERMQARIEDKPVTVTAAAAAAQQDDRCEGDDQTLLALLLGLLGVLLLFGHVRSDATR